MADEIQCAECDRPVGDRLTLCTFCGNRLRAELLSVPGVLADLATMRAGQARFSSGRVGSRSTDAALPIQTAGAELRGDRAYTRLETAVGGWARVLSEHLRVEIPIGARGLMQLALNGRVLPIDRAATIHRTPDGKYARLIRRHPDALTSPATPLEQAAVWMACHPHQLRAHEAAHEMITEIVGALTALRRVVDRPAEMNYLGPCRTVLDGGQDCGFVLRAERGKTDVQCGRCKEIFYVADLQAKAREIAEDRLYTRREMHGVLAAIGTRVPPRTLTWWVSNRGETRLEPRGWKHEDAHGVVRITDHQISEDDQQVYRLGDALALAARRQDEGGSAA